MVQLAVMAVVSLRAARFGLIYLAEGAYPAALASLAALPMLLILLMAII